MDERQKNEYLTVLCTKVQLYSESILAKTLNEIEYVPKLHADHDRLTSARDYRVEICNEMWFGVPTWEFAGPISVLEVLITLAVECERRIMGGNVGNGDRTPEWFWTMMRNLHLDSYYETGADWHEEACKTSIKEIISRWMNNEYEHDGDGGLFVLKSPPQPVYTMPIWDQLTLYLYENYSYEFRIGRRRV